MTATNMCSNFGSKEYSPPPPLSYMENCYELCSLPLQSIPIPNAVVAINNLTLQCIICVMIVNQNLHCSIIKIII